ncbi:hypothetical protein ACWGF2_19865 [Streptomyces sp. NPDC054919]
MWLTGEFDLQEAGADLSQYLLMTGVPLGAEPVRDELQHRGLARAECPRDHGQVPYSLFDGEVDVIGPVKAGQPQTTDPNAG